MQFAIFYTRKVLLQLWCRACLPQPSEPGERSGCISRKSRARVVQLATHCPRGGGRLEGPAVQGTSGGRLPHGRAAAAVTWGAL